jgi:Mn-dependent DtxR family transcriptional regulator
MSTEVPDGATQRHSRMMELLTFINLNEPHGATITHIQAHMLQVFGLKFRTTSEMVRELAMSGTVKVDGHGFYHLTEKQQAAMKTLVAQEKTSNVVDPLIKRIDKVKDDKARIKLEKLASRLYEVLLEAESHPTKEQQ